MKLYKQLFRFTFIAFLFFQSIGVFSLDIPPLKGPVNDYAQLLTGNEAQELNDYLYSIDQNSDLQIAVLTIPSLENESIEDYSIRVAEQWKIGKKGKDSGIILLIAAQDRRVRIEVGYGLEGLVTDAQASRIIRSVIAPYFKNRAYGKGILLGVKNVAGLALQDESLISQAVNASDKPHEDSIPFPIVIFLIIIFLFGSRFMPGGLLWPLLFFSSSRRSSGYFGCSGGYSSSGGSGCSFFSGGGGSFGGGGASGSW